MLTSLGLSTQATAPTQFLNRRNTFADRESFEHVKDKWLPQITQFTTDPSMQAMLLGHDVDMLASVHNAHLPIFWSRWWCRQSAAQVETIYVENAAHAHACCLDVLLAGGPQARAASGRPYHVTNGEPAWPLSDVYAPLALGSTKKSR